MPHNTQNSYKVSKAKVSKNKTSQVALRGLINQFRQRVRLLENSRQHYQQNPSLAENLKTANITIIQSELDILKGLLENMKREIVFGLIGKVSFKKGRI